MGNTYTANLYAGDATAGHGGLFFGGYGNGTIIGDYTAMSWPGTNSLAVGGNLSVSTNATVSGTLGVTGAATLGNSLTLNAGTGKLYFPGAAYDQIQFSAASPTIYWMRKQANSYAFAVYNATAGAFRFMVEDGGNAWLSQGGGKTYVGYTSDQGSYALQVNGTVYASGYYKSSARRWKRNIRDLDVDAPALLRVLRAREWEAKVGRVGAHGVGFVAEELQEAGAPPDMVDVNADGMAVSIAEDYWNPLLVLGWKAHDQQIHAHAARLDGYESRLDGHAARLDGYESRLRTVEAQLRVR